MPSPALMDEFLGACEKGNNETVRWFLKYFPAQWGCHRAGKIGLMYAAENGHVGTARLLLELGSNINSADNTGWTALFYAVRGGKPEVAEFLIGKGASVNRKTGSGKTALHAAVMSGCTKTMKLLLDNKAEVDARDAEGETPLSLAAKTIKPDAARLLLDRGASLTATVDGVPLMEAPAATVGDRIFEMLKEEPARRAEQIDAAIGGGIAGEFTLKGALKFARRKQEEPKPSASFTPLQRPVFS